MASHRYSHALVLSHYETSGLLSHEQRRRTPTKSIRKPRPKELESRVIQEVFSPLTSPPLASLSLQDSYFARNQTQPPESPPPLPQPHPVFSMPSLNRSDSIVTQIFAPPRPQSPFEGANCSKKTPMELARKDWSSGLHDERELTRLKIHDGSEEYNSHQFRKPPGLAVITSPPAQSVQRNEPLQEPSFDTEDESDQDASLRRSAGAEQVSNYPLEGSSTRQDLEPRLASGVHRKPAQDNLPEASNLIGQRGNAEVSGNTIERRPHSSMETKHSLEPAALTVRRRTSHDQTTVQKPLNKTDTRAGYTIRTIPSHTEKHSKQKWNRVPSSPSQPTGQEIRYGHIPVSPSRRKTSDKATSSIDYFSSRRPSLDTRLELSQSSGEPKSPNQPLPLDVRVKAFHTQLPTEKPLPQVPDFQEEDPRARPIRVRTRGYASACRHSWASRDSSRQNSVINRSVKPIRNMAPPRESLIRAAAMEKQKALKLTSKKSIEAWYQDVSHVYTQQKASSDIKRADPEAPTKDALPATDIKKSRPSSDESPSNSRPHSDVPSSGTESQRPSTNTNSRRPSAQTTPPTSPSLASVFSFSSTLSSPKQLENIHIYNKDMIVLPWDHDLQMGPSLFCTSPPPPEHPISPPSPGSSIDDATPPPISRVRDTEGNRRKISDFSSGKKTPRPRALSNSTATSPRLASPPPEISPLRADHPPPQQTPRPRLSFSITRPSFSTNLSAVPYAVTVPGPAPIPTTEKVLVPPPKEEPTSEAEDLELDKRRFRHFWRGGIGAREIFGLGRKGAKPEAGLTRGMVPT